MIKEETVNPENKPESQYHGILWINREKCWNAGKRVKVLYKAYPP